MPVRPSPDTGDEFVNELTALGVGPSTINRVFQEILQYTRSLNQKELRERARIVRRIRKNGK